MFQHLASRSGVDLETIRILIGGKEYRFDQEEVRKKIKDVGIENKHTIFMVVRLKGGYEYSASHYHSCLVTQLTSIRYQNNE